MLRQLHLGGFQIASQVTHSNAAWRHPGSTGNYTTRDYYQRIGHTLERGKFDMVFFADLLAMTTRFGAGQEDALRYGSQASATIDPILAATSIAAVTERLGVAVTKSTTFFHPYEVARIFRHPRPSQRWPGRLEHRHLAQLSRGSELRCRFPPRSRHAL